MDITDLFRKLKKELDEILGLDGINEQKISLANYPNLMKFYEMLISKEELYKLIGG